MQHSSSHRRRKKQRSNVSPKLRTVEVNRSYNGFGFTISGQQPCILSCIVPNSPADLAGLRAGNFLISVNSTNVSKLHHEAIVQLIGNSCGTVRLQIADNYFSDSSDDEQQSVSSSVSILTTPTNRRFSSHHKSRSRHKISPLPADVLPLHPVIEDLPVMAAHDIIPSPNASTSNDVTNISAMVRVGVSLEYRVILGYLGTIEMPKQIVTSSKLQTVRSCIRKLRQEKRNPTTVLMTILPNCLILRSEDSQILATLPSSRLNYVSSSSESENRFFGLVTSTIYSEDDSDNEGAAGGVEISISSSCHVFVVDPKICEHSIHEMKARDFNIDCTKDPISNLCLEFPNNSEYVVNLIRSMYTMRVFPNPTGKPPQHDQHLVGGHSPLPSNHSEITTTSSNSDSGIGFHNDMAHISDKILLVDFPAKDRLTVRAMPNVSPMVSAKSLENVLSISGERERYRRSVQYAIDDIAIHTTPKSSKDHIFLMPAEKPMRNKMRKMELEDKFSPQVYQTPEKKENLYLELWGSLHNIHRSEFFVEDGEEENVISLEGAYSVPDLTSRALPSNSSPFKRWGQSSFRAPRVTEQLSPLTRRPSSLVASENDVYTKSMDAMMIDGLTPVANSTKCANRKISAPCRPLNGAATDDTEERGVLSWGTSFEKLLADPAGMNTFAEFLKKEYSAENIYFWAACERYRQIDNDSDRQKQAVEIFSKHLSNGAMEPVNVDSHARNFAQQNLNGADRTLFHLAQKQIFHLMKFDSYQRFIRSDLYKKCLECFQKKLPLPYPGEQLDELLRTATEAPGPSKLKKSASNAEDRRRKSLLPWHRKTRCKSRDRTEPPIIELQKSKSSTAIKSFSNTLKLPNSGSSDIHSSRSSLSSFDTNFQEEHHRKVSISNGACTLCKVILSDGATTVVQTNATETVRQLVERLLEKRGLNYSFYDVYMRDTNQLVNLQESSAILARYTVYVEQIVAFKLVLPNSKHISVKCKPKKLLSEVLNPILHKYSYRMEDVVKIVIKDSQKELELSVPVTNVDGQRLQVHMTKMLPIQSNGGQQQPHPQPQQHTLDEITNKVFNELLKEKVDSNGNTKHQVEGGGAADLDNQSMKSEDCISESSSLFDRIRRKDTTNIPTLRSNRQKKVVISNHKPILISPSEEQNGNILAENSEPHLTSLTSSSPTVTAIASAAPASSTIPANQKPLIAKWKTGAKLQCTERTEKQGEEFIEGLKRAQRARLEDQRGVEINFELPDFLKNNENMSAANKLRKIRANLSPINRQQPTESTKSNNNPVPAPRLSLTKPIDVVENGNQTVAVATTTTIPTVPPPLPPKPKVLPAKPSNWGQNTSSSSSNLSGSLNLSGSTNSPGSVSSSNSNSLNLPSSTKIISNDIRRQPSDQKGSGSAAYLDQPSSSFV